MNYWVEIEPVVSVLVSTGFMDIFLKFMINVTETE